MKVYFSDFFNVTPSALEEYGAFNISLINDIPLFIDPFLIFMNQKPEYQKLHINIIEYVKLLITLSKSKINVQSNNLFFLFPEVKQNWLGFSQTGNSGNGLAQKFALTLKRNLTSTLFNDFNNINNSDNRISSGNHVEKLCLLNDGVGKDHISDFVTNIIKQYILEYTESFAKKYISQNLIRPHKIKYIDFSNDKISYSTRFFSLPTFNDDFVLLTPKNILTKDKSWINRRDMLDSFHNIVNGLSNSQLRININTYFETIFSKIPNPKQKDKDETITQTINKFPDLLDYYIANKEKNSTSAEKKANLIIRETEFQFIKNTKLFIELLNKNTTFYKKIDTVNELITHRIIQLRIAIETLRSTEFLYIKNTPISREEDLIRICRLIWFAIAEYKITYSIIKDSYKKLKFKLASNTKLTKTINRDLNNGFTFIIFYFSYSEKSKLLDMLKSIDNNLHENIIFMNSSLILKE